MRSILFVFLSSAVFAQTTTTTTMSLPATALLGDLVTITANVQPSSAGTVEFVDGYIQIGTATLSNSVATLKYRFTRPGRHDIRAVFAGSADGTTSFSATKTIKITSRGFAGFVRKSDAAWFYNIADVNGDSIRDLIVGTPSSWEEFGVRLGNGDGTFQPPIMTSPASGFAPLADFDLDGKIDISVPGGYLKGNGNGSFGARQTLGQANLFRVPADLNLDGRVDFLCPSDRLDAALSLPNGAWSKTLDFGCTYANLYVGNLNNDEVGDFGAMLYIPPAPGASGCALALSQPGGAFSIVGCGVPNGNLMWTGDFNGDGLLDVIVGANNVPMPNFNRVVRINNGDGTFTVRESVIPWESIIAVLDWNNDGQDDLISVAADLKYSVEISRGDGTFLTPQPLGWTPPKDVVIQQFTEVNGDGRPDLLVYSPTAGEEIWVGAGSSAPSAGTATPDSVVTSAGENISLSLPFSALDGSQNVTELYVRVSSGPTAFEVCDIFVDLLKSKVGLVGGAGTTVPSMISPGSGYVSNATCFLNGSGTSWVRNGTNILLTVNFGLFGNASGSRNVYARAVDLLGGDSGFQPVAKLRVEPGAPSLPQIATLSPASGSGSAAQFRITLSDANADLGLVYLLINTSLDGVDACMVELNRVAGTLRVLADDAKSWSSPAEWGSPSTRTSNQCSVKASDITIIPQGKTIQLTVPVTFFGHFSGTANVYVQAIDLNGQSTGLLPLGTWTVTPAVTMNGAPAVQSLTPTSGSGPSGTFTGVFTHPDGSAAHYLAYMLFLPTPNLVQFTAKGSCLVEYNRISNGVRLINDAGDDWLGPISGVPITAGAPSLSNAMCTVDVSGVQATVGGPTLTVSVPITFSSDTRGVLATFLQAFDVKGKFTGMTQFGNWVSDYRILAQRPGPLMNSGAVVRTGASSATVSALVGHTAALEQLSMVHLLIGSSISDPAPCQVVIFPPVSVNLINDSGTALVGAQHAVAGVGPVLSNARCTVDAAKTTSSIYTDKLRWYTLPVTFSSGFTGHKNVYAVAFGADGLVSHWIQIGELNLP